MKLVTVLGGSGVFGGRIVQDLARYPGTCVRVVGRSPARANRLVAECEVEFRAGNVSEPQSLRQAIEGSFLVVHAAGPFQGTDYRVAECCISCGAHYLDISDARDFVCGIGALDAQARNRGLLIASGASSVPAISGAMIRELAPQFRSIHEIDIALSPGNQNPRGSSTIAAILTYLGRPIRMWQDGTWDTRIGWSNGCPVQFPNPVGKRTVYYCESPDLDLFPKTWHANTVRFRAGLELSILNGMLASLSKARRLFGLRRLPQWASFLAWTSQLLLPFGSRCGALGVWLGGLDYADEVIQRRIALVTDSDGPAIPVAPACVLARSLLDRGPAVTGAFACDGLITLDEIMTHLRDKRVWLVHGSGDRWEDHRT